MKKKKESLFDPIEFSSNRPRLPHVRMKSLSAFCRDFLVPSPVLLLLLRARFNDRLIYTESHRIARVTRECARRDVGCTLRDPRVRPKSEMTA